MANIATQAISDQHVIFLVISYVSSCWFLSIKMEFTNAGAVPNDVFKIQLLD